MSSDLQRLYICTSCFSVFACLFVETVGILALLVRVTLEWMSELTRSLQDHETLLADAIRPKPVEDTWSGCGSKHWPAAGG